MRLYHANKLDLNAPCPPDWVGNLIILSADLMLPIELGSLPSDWQESSPAAIVCRNTEPFAARLLSQAGIHVATTTDSLAGIRDGAEVILDLDASIVKDDAGRKYVLVVA